MKPEELSRRLTRIETSNRNLKRLLFSIVGIAILSCCMAANYHNCCEHRASRFVLVDSCGVERATLCFDNGEPVLKMIGSSGATQVKLGITEVHADSASLYLQNATKNSFMSIGATSTQECSTIEFGGGRKRINLRTNLPGTNANIRITDENGETTLDLP